MKCFIYGDVPTQYQSGSLRAFGLKNFRKSPYKSGVLQSWEEFASVKDAEAEIKAIFIRMLNSYNSDTLERSQNEISYDCATISIYNGTFADSDFS